MLLEVGSFVGTSFVAEHGCTLVAMLLEVEDAMVVQFQWSCWRVGQILLLLHQIPLLMKVRMLEKLEKLKG